MKCQYQTITPSGRAAQIRTVDHDFLVQQQRPDCSSALAAQTGWDTAFSYNDRICIQKTTSGGYKTINPNGWSDLFTNSDPTNCPLDSCTLSQYSGSTCGGTVGSSNSRDNAQLTFDKATQSLELGIDTQEAQNNQQRLCVSCNVFGEPSVEFITGYHSVGANILDNKNPFDVDNLCLKMNTYDTSIKNAGWDYKWFFDNPQKCKPDCVLYESGCQVLFPDYTDTQVWMLNTKTNPVHGLRYKTNVAYDHKICIKCSLNLQVPNTGTEIFYLEKTQEYQITVRTPNSCSTTLSSNTKTPSWLSTNLAYDDSSPGLFYDLMSSFTGFISWDDYFGNSNVNCCPITQCVLKTSPNGGNSWPTVLGNTDYVYMDSNNNILARKDILDGYSVEFKVECQNDDGDKVEDTRFEVNLAGFVKQESLPQKNKPTFSQDLQQHSLIINLSNKTNNWDIILPTIEDPQDDFSVIKIKSPLFGETNNFSPQIPSSNLIYIADANVLQVVFEVTEYKQFLGSHLIQILLQDNEDHENIYFLNVNVDLPETKDDKSQYLAQIEEILMSQSQQTKDNQATGSMNYAEAEDLTVKAKIRHIQQYGLTEIIFNREMKTDRIDIKSINKTLLDIYVRPFEDWHIYESNFEVQPNLNLTWEVIQYKNNRILIDVRFLNPLQVSPKARRDDLVVHFNQNATNLLVSEENYMIYPDYHTISKDIPKQLTQDLLSLSGAATAVAQVVQVTLVMSSALAPVSTGPIFFIIAMINQLQLVMHLPMLNLPVPANILLLQQFLMKVVTFDVIDDKIKEKFRHFLRGGRDPFRGEEEEDIEDIPGQVQSLGYESHYIDNNMDMVIFALMVWQVRVFIYWTIYPICIRLLSRTHNEQILPSEIDLEIEQAGQNENGKGDSSSEEATSPKQSKNEKVSEVDIKNESVIKEGGDIELKIENDESMDKVHDKIVEGITEQIPQTYGKDSLGYKAHVFCLKRRLKLNRQIFFNELLIILIEGYLEFTVSFTLQVRSDEKWVAFLIGIAIFIIVPTIIIYAALQDQKTLESKFLQNKIGVVYMNLKTNHPSKVLHSFSFVLRRFMFVILTQTTYMYDHIAISLIFLALFFLAVGMYHGYVMPFESMRNNKIELANEMFFGMHLYMTMCYTDFVTTPNAQFQAGWMHIYILLAQLIFNFTFLLKEILNSFRLCIIKFYNWVMDDPVGRKIKLKEEKRARNRKAELKRISKDAYRKELKRLSKEQRAKAESPKVVLQTFGVVEININPKMLQKDELQGKDGDSEDKSQEVDHPAGPFDTDNGQVEESVPQNKGKSQNIKKKEQTITAVNHKIDDLIKVIEDYHYEPRSLPQEKVKIEYFVKPPSIYDPEFKEKMNRITQKQQEGKIEYFEKPPSFFDPEFKEKMNRKAQKQEEEKTEYFVKPPSLIDLEFKQKMNRIAQQNLNSDSQHIFEIRKQNAQTREVTPVQSYTNANEFKFKFPKISLRNEEKSDQNQNQQIKMHQFKLNIKTLEQVHQEQREKEIIANRTRIAYNHDLDEADKILENFDQKEEAKGKPMESVDLSVNDTKWSSQPYKMKLNIKTLEQIRQEQQYEILGWEKQQKREKAERDALDQLRYQEYQANVDKIRQILNR